MLDEIVIRDESAGGWRRFTNPERVLVAKSPAAVRQVLREAEQAVDDQGLVAAGYVCYEAASAFDASLQTRTGGSLPLACFGLFADSESVGQLPAATPVADPDWQLDVALSLYRGNIAHVRRQIELGNCYQVNYTIRKRAAGAVDPWQLFLAIGRHAPYGAYLAMDSACVVSASPELFFQLAGTAITCRPMKGTARRAMTTARDADVAAGLLASAKNRAENVMIADMIRNDLGRVANAGTVRVPALYELEKYPTVWQMTSTVQADTTAGLAALFAALFPCASVTGAPKTAAMRVIADIEDSPRGIYTGAIGWYGPERRAQFSVAIRTAVIDRGGGSATYGVGGGIVWDSDADDEYRECQAKAEVLTRPLPGDGEFELLETLLWTPGHGYALLDYHLDRLLESAAYFDFSLDRAHAGAALDATAASCTLPTRVRLLASRNGEVRVESTTLATNGPPEQRVRLAAQAVSSNDPFLYHKTTHRAVYENASRGAGDVDDVLLWNERGEVTESTRANVIVRLEGQDVTPPVASGLLAGTLRRRMLEQGRLTERVVHCAELGTAEGLWLINSVRGRMPVKLLS